MYANTWYNAVMAEQEMVPTPEQHVGPSATITPARISELTRVVAQGNYLTTACQTLGIPYRTYQEWRKKGSEQREEGVIAEDSLYVLLVDELEAALSYGEERAVAAWTSAFDTDWRAAENFLARRFPERWAKRDSKQAAIAISVQEIHLRLPAPEEEFLYPDPDSIVDTTAEEAVD